MASVNIESLAVWRDSYIRAHEEVTRWQAVKDQSKERIRDELDEADADVGLIDGSPAVRLIRTAGRFDTKRFAADHPELYEEYRGEPGSRFEIVE